MKQTWNIEITLCRSFNGTKEEAEEVAQSDWLWYESQVDGNDNVNYPCDLTINEINTKSYEKYQQQGCIINTTNSCSSTTPL